MPLFFPCPSSPVLPSLLPLHTIPFCEEEDEEQDWFEIVRRAFSVHCKKMLKGVGKTLTCPVLILSQESWWLRAMLGCLQGPVSKTRRCKYWLKLWRRWRIQPTVASHRRCASRKVAQVVFQARCPCGEAACMLVTKFFQLPV